MRRDVGHATADTPDARRKQRIGGILLTAGILFNLIATLLPLSQRSAATVLFATGGTCLLVAVVYYVLARRPA